MRPLTPLTLPGPSCRVAALPRAPHAQQEKKGSAPAPPNGGRSTIFFSCMGVGTEQPTLNFMRMDVPFTQFLQYFLFYLTNPLPVRHTINIYCIKYIILLLPSLCIVKTSLYTSYGGLHDETRPADLHQPLRSPLYALYGPE